METITIPISKERCVAKRSFTIGWNAASTKYRHLACANFRYMEIMI